MKGLTRKLVEWDAQMMKLDDGAEARQAEWSSKTSALQGTGSAWQTHSVYKVHNLLFKVHYDSSKPKPLLFTKDDFTLKG